MTKYAFPFFRPSGPWVKNAGFTMIELMLVVVIIGILAAVVVPRLVGRTQKARISASKLAITSVSTALEAFELDLGRFPTTEEGLDALLQKPASLTAEDEWQGPYLKERPLDAWNRALVYTFPGSNAVDFDLVSAGPDGRQGTEDDISGIRKEQK